MIWDRHVLAINLGQTLNFFETEQKDFPGSLLYDRQFRGPIFLPRGKNLENYWGVTLPRPLFLRACLWLVVLHRPYHPAAQIQGPAASPPPNLSGQNFPL